jgi:phage terminase large subunit-like protein
MPRWKRPHDVKSWRAFWRLPKNHESYTDADWLKWHEWRCTVLEDTHHLGIHYDAAEAARHVAFFRALKHVKGEWAGKRFGLLPWQQRQILETVFGYVMADGRRLFRDVLGFVPKKSGKSELAGGLILDQLLIEHEPGCECYGGAKNLKQARLVFDVVHAMVKQDAMLRGLCKPLESTKRLVIPNANGADDFYEVLSADVSSKEGPSVQCLVFDEIEVIPHSLYNVMTDGTSAARRQPIRLYIGTGGDDFSLPWVDLLEYAQGIEDGAIQNDPHFLPVLYMLRDGDDWTKEANWYKANPSLGHTITIEGFRSEFARAKATPHKQASFKRRRLNMLVQDDAFGYLPMPEWEACSVTGSLDVLAKARAEAMERLKGRQCVGWMDLSSVTDITTFGLLFPMDDGKYETLEWFFLPRDNVDKRGDRDRAEYRQWADHGFLTLTDGTRMDYQAVRACINAARTAGYKFREIAYDDWNAGNIEQELMRDGFEMIPIAQSLSTMNSPTKELLGLTLSGKLDHHGNPVMRYMAGNLSVKSDHNERVQPTKAKSRGRIDGIVGIIMALSRVMDDHDDGPSVYETRGVRTL